MLSILITYSLEFVLQDHDRDIDNHDSKCDKVDISNNSNHQILMRNSRREEGHEQGKFFGHPSPSHRIVNVTHQKAVNWEVPLPPVLG